MNKLVRYDPFAELSALQKHSLGNDQLTTLKGAYLPTTDVYSSYFRNLR